MEEQSSLAGREVHLVAICEYTRGLRVSVMRSDESKGPVMQLIRAGELDQPRSSAHHAQNLH
jgi:hypothetical protein